MQGGDPRALRPGGAQLGVEVRERLVEQEGDRPAQDGAAGDTLAWPPESWPGRRSSSCSISSIRASSAMRAAISAFGSRVFSSPKARFWRRLMCG